MNKAKEQCKNLRHKRMYVDNSDSVTDQNESMTRQYWCLATMATFGPDDNFVAAERCGQHRSCFKSKELIV